MIERILTIAGFKYGIANGIKKDQEAKALLIQDSDSSTIIQILMTKEEMKQMIELMRKEIERE